MTKLTPTIERHASVKRIALFGLLTALPIAATAVVLAQGDTVLWSQIERGLARLGVGEANAQTYDCNGQWTNNPNCNLTITDCDCSDSDSDSDGSAIPNL